MCGSPQRGTIPVKAAIHDGKYSRIRGPLRGLIVDDAVLEPNCGDPQADALIDDRGNMLGAPEDIDNVDALAGSQHFVHAIKTRDYRFAEQGSSRRVDRNDPITELLK